jgi:hypothetical protein
MAIPRREMDSALKATFVPRLKSLGFKGGYPHFRRVGTQRLEVVGIQFSQWGAQFYVEAGLADKNGVSVEGVLVPPERLKHYHAWPRKRFGDLPFDYEAEAISVVAAKSAAIVEDIAAWFAQQAGVT